MSAICLQLDSKTSIMDLSNCSPNCEKVQCLVNAVACTGCAVIPPWEQFELDLNPTIVSNLEADGNYDSVPELIRATEVEIDAVPGIGPASITIIRDALAKYNLTLAG